MGRVEISRGHGVRGVVPVDVLRIIVIQSTINARAGVMYSQFKI